MLSDVLHRRLSPSRIVAIGLTLVGLVATGGLTACQPVFPGTSCPMFPTTSHWHAKVTGLPVTSNSSAMVSTVGATSPLKADFGSGLWNGGPIGIPYVVVAATQPRVSVSFDYAD